RNIRAGAIQRANGGYLVMNARDLLANQSAYDALKRALREGAVTVESSPDQNAALPVATLRPEPVPLQIRVVLIDDAGLYTRRRSHERRRRCARSTWPARSTHAAAAATLSKRSCSG